MGRRNVKTTAVETLEVPKSALTYSSALGKVGSGAADLGKATGILALLATRDAVALGKSGIDKAVAAGNRRTAAKVGRAAAAPVVATGSGANHTTRNRLILGGVVVAALAVGGFAFRWLRSQNELPEPAAAPPSVRDVSTNGSVPTAARPAGRNPSLN
ncbi:hypothetical protein [Aldersonia kunmingensis]|uniref:hypothetical protein n=1 Tax=Aldersonia kunmingensis TaxID=408066 RepID=UPI00083383F3|nr:hypothetical protein [Aldersonia kunmingensis]